MVFHCFSPPSFLEPKYLLDPVSCCSLSTCSRRTAIFSSMVSSLFSISSAVCSPSCRAFQACANSLGSTPLLLVVSSTVIQENV
ncbi:ZYRO0D09372p [Zygosaccharomyces rouxii]|uniref:ZYRO0D09372p n=1 Tax=Zygosaccharomyces rouxii (strain ATCC 2623 / CBS 732 / NBRC 1130 / NCYC 568 / NRRL Y-229) TaxID=559307 RepID=C5DVU0_ZYGRC|nr:uncharacterized protein ZYRO0D09372g [Zygosaccharomyces rouxii]CAR27909.1 ZYRO0D09372p [Zygosaccharomyces rouxii]